MRGRRKRKAERREMEKAGGNKMEGRGVWQFELLGELVGTAVQRVCFRPFR